MNKLAKDIMTKEVVWTYPEESLYDAFQVMRQFDIRHLPVVSRESEQLIGLLSEGDILLHATKKGTQLSIDENINVSEAMSKEVVHCFYSSQAVNVAATMIVAKIDSIPVIESGSKKIIGIVTTTDLLDEICTREELNGTNVMPLKYGTPNSRIYTPISKS